MTNEQQSFRLGLLFSSALAVGYPATCLAQAATTDQATLEPSAQSKDQLDEIVVTATKTAESLQDVPISISAYRQERMDQLGVRTIEDITALTPGVQIEQVRERASGTNISIRGVSSLIGAGTTGIYIDDAPIQVRIIGFDATNVYPLVFDLERVEVLRGPQGTLYGAGSMGGNVRFITPEPSLNDLEIYARAEIAMTEHGAPSYEAGVAVGAPIIADKIGIRLSGWHRRDGGWVDRANFQTGNVTDDDSNYQETTVFRGALAFAPSETLTITPSVYYQDVHVNDTSSYWSTLSDRSRDIYKNGYPNQYQTYDDYFVLPSLDIELELGSVLLTSSTSYFKRKAYNQWDYSTVVPAILTRGALQTLPGYLATSYFIDRQENWTEELRLQSANPDARLTWVAGLYYGHRTQTNFQSIDAVGYNFLLATLRIPPAALPPLVDSGEFGLSTLLIHNRTVDEQIAAFGEVNFKLTEAFTITGGLRVERAKLDFFNVQSGPFNGPLSGGTAAPKVTPVTPKISVSYDLDDDNMVYATAAKGYRIGGGNAVLPPNICAAAMAEIGITAAPTSFEPDSLWSYEVGSKNTLFDGRLQVNSSAFLIDWTNIQQQVFPRCGFQYVENIGGARSIGFDIQARAQLTDALTLGAQVGYVNAKYTTDAFPNDNTNLKPLVRAGNGLKIQPWNVVLTGDYRQPISDTATFYANATMIYRSHDDRPSPFLDPLTALPDPIRVNMDASTIVNARLGVQLSRLDVAFFAKNLLNSRARTSVNHDHLNARTLLKETSLRPRTYGVTATFRY